MLPFWDARGTRSKAGASWLQGALGCMFRFFGFGVVWGLGVSGFGGVFGCKAQQFRRLND